jgi:hypothetical protein
MSAIEFAHPTGSFTVARQSHGAAVETPEPSPVPGHDTWRGAALWTVSKRAGGGVGCMNPVTSQNAAISSGSTLCAHTFGGGLRALRWSDVDLEPGMIRVERSWDDRVGRLSQKPLAHPTRSARQVKSPASPTAPS